MTQQPSPWSYPTTRYIMNDKWLKLRADTAVSPDGTVINDLYITENKDWGNCLVIVDGQVIMLRHYRHGIRDTVLEIPAGHIEPNDPTSAAAIKRELAEEIGLRDARIHYVGKTYANPANQTNVTYSFLAVGGTLTADTDIHEEYFTVVPLPLQDFAQALKEQSETFQALHLANILLSFQFVARYDGDDAEVLALKPFVREYFS